MQQGNAEKFSLITFLINDVQWLSTYQNVRNIMELMIDVLKMYHGIAEGWDEDSEGFNGVYEENLIGDEEDQMRLVNMNEKEREMELFARSEKREVLKTRYEIERKLRMAKKKEMIQSQTKMRSNERRRNMEKKRKVKNAIKGLKVKVHFESKLIGNSKTTVDGKY
uniref:Uncharacterized protein n=1 Tax=Tetranychus urticae TaxID=32264 RepID=T1JZR1_TETUR